MMQAADLTKIALTSSQSGLRKALRSLILEALFGCSIKFVMAEIVQRDTKKIPFKDAP